MISYKLKKNDSANGDEFSVRLPCYRKTIPTDMIIVVDAPEKVYSCYLTKVELADAYNAKGVCIQQYVCTYKKYL